MKELKMKNVKMLTADFQTKIMFQTMALYYIKHMLLCFSRELVLHTIFNINLITLNVSNSHQFLCQQANEREQQNQLCYSSLFIENLQIQPIDWI